MWGTELFVMGAMILVNSVFACYEIALASVSLPRLHILRQDRQKGAAAAVYMKENMEGSLAGIQLGITLVGAIAAATGGAGAEEDIAPYLSTTFAISAGVGEFLAISLVVLPLSFVTIVFGELVPKVFALRNKELVCLRLSPLLRWFVFAVRPIVWTLESTVTAIMSWGERRLKDRLESAGTSRRAELQELEASVALARTSRLIGSQQERIILGATALSRRAIREIMLPANAISMLDVNGTIGDALIAAHLDMHTRFPLTERKGDPQAIIGYVNFKDIVAHIRLAPNDPTLRAITRTIPTISEDSPISSCLERLIREHVHIALIGDSVNGVVGMITLEDMLEELVGEIEDEFDRLPQHVVKSGESWVVGGGARLGTLLDATGIELTSPEMSDVNSRLTDWVTGQIGNSVRGGEIIESPTVRVVIRKVRRQKVFEIQIQ